MKKVLLIDDDDEVRQTISGSLNAKGYEVTDVDNGKEALMRMSAQTFDLVVCDLFMPDKDGVETILEIKRNHPLTPIILITGGGRLFPIGGGGLEDLLQSVEFFGITHFLMKPFRPSQLISLVESALTLHEK